MSKKFFDSLNPDEADCIETKIALRSLKECIPTNLTIELTQSCNFSCNHCYNFDRTTVTKAPNEERKLKKSEVLDILTQVKEKGGFNICFTGGEVLIVPELNEYITKAKELGFYVRLKSNGSLFDEERAKELSSLGVNQIEFSVYGSTNDVLKEFTGFENQEKVWEAFRLAKKYDLNPQANIILHSKNVDQFVEIVSKLREIDVNFAISTGLTKRYDGSGTSLDYRVSQEQLERLTETKEGHLLLPQKSEVENVQCACARSNCGIGFDGTVYPCIGAPIPSGNIREKSFSDIWDNSPVFKRIRGVEFEDFKDCITCEDRKYCGRSSGLIYVNTGNYTGSEKQTCEQAAFYRKKLDK